MALGGYQIGEKFRTKGTDLQDAEKSIYFDGYGALGRTFRGQNETALATEGC